MATYNRVILVGNLTRDIELRYTPAGTAVADIALAVNERRKAASGEWVEEVTFVDITMWGRTAEVASEYLGKGSPILVEGRLRQERWESEGKKRSKLKVVCERMQMLSGTNAPASSGNATTTDSSAKSKPASSSSTSSSGKQNDDSDSFGSESHEQSSGYDQPGQRDAQPTGSGPGYDDPDIPF